MAFFYNLINEFFFQKISLCTFNAFFCMMLLFSPLCALPYTTTINGITEKQLLKEMQKASATYLGQKDGILTPISLKLRATGDVDRLKNVAQNAGFFNCTVEPIVSFSDDGSGFVTFNVTLGPKFTFGKLQIVWSDEDIVRSLFSSHPDWIEKRIPSISYIPSYKEGDFVTGKRLLAIPEELRNALRSRAYAFCKIVDTQLLADRNLQRVDVTITVQTGPITRFGPIVPHGAPNIDEACFKANLAWKTGDFYTPKLIDKTESALQRTGLFQSVQIDEGSSITDDWMIPMNIRVTEAKPRTVSAGISYTTTYGPGCQLGWEHRNISGLGRKLNFGVEYWEKMKVAKLSYTIPNFCKDDQNLIWIVEHNQQTYLPFESYTTRGSVLLDKQLTKRTDAVVGLSLERLASYGIIRHEDFHLFKIPGQFRWSSANSPLDPTKGISFTIRLTPAYQIIQPCFSYLIHSSSLAGYYSIYQDKVTFALRAQVGNICGASRNTIPLPDRLFGGSENSLRGYKTGSVSPLSRYGQPIGGRSMATGTFEVRVRNSTNLGWVAFYDVGNVFSQMIPPPQDIWFRHSVGFGFRYQTPIGPLRLDFGVPLQRRRHLDPPFQIYFSIGQAF